MRHVVLKAVQGDGLFHLGQLLSITLRVRALRIYVRRALGAARAGRPPPPGGPQKPKCKSRRGSRAGGAPEGGQCPVL